MEKLLTQEEILALRNEYYETKDKVLELTKHMDEIDATIVRNSCNIVANRFIPLKFGDKIRVTLKRCCYSGYETEVKEGFFGSYYMDERHPYTEDNGVSAVKIWLYQIKKDGTRSQKTVGCWTRNIVSIEKLED